MLYNGTVKVVSEEEFASYTNEEIVANGYAKVFYPLTLQFTAPNETSPSITLELSDIKMESVVFEENLCSEETLKFGLCELNKFECIVSGLDTVVKNYKMYAFATYMTMQDLGGIYEPKFIQIPYGYFIVDSCKKESDMALRKIIAYSEPIAKDKLINVKAIIGQFKRKLTIPVPRTEFHSMFNFTTLLEILNGTLDISTFTGLPTYTQIMVDAISYKSDGIYTVKLYSDVYNVGNSNNIGLYRLRLNPNKNNYSTAKMLLNNLFDEKKSDVILINNNLDTVFVDCTDGGFSNRLYFNMLNDVNIFSLSTGTWSAGNIEIVYPKRLVITKTSYGATPIEETLYDISLLNDVVKYNNVGDSKIGIDYYGNVYPTKNYPSILNNLITNEMLMNYSDTEFVSRLDFMKSTLELFGVFGKRDRITNEVKLITLKDKLTELPVFPFEYNYLYPSSDTYPMSEFYISDYYHTLHGMPPSETLLPSESLLPDDSGYKLFKNDIYSVWYDDFKVDSFERIVVVGDINKTFKLSVENAILYNGSYVYDVFTDDYEIVQDCGNTYFIENNLIFEKFIIPSDNSTTYNSTQYNYTVVQFLKEMLENMRGITYVPMDLVTVGKLTREVGDIEYIMLDNVRLRYIVLNRTLSGLYQLVDESNLEGIDINEELQQFTEVEEDII